MLKFTESFFDDNDNLDIEAVINTRWGTIEIETLLEHAIVHVLRHRRQIEIFKFKLNQ